MKIAFDLDSVLNKLHESWERWIKQFDPDFEMSNVTGWNISEHTIMRDEVFDFLHLPRVFAELEVTQHAQDLLLALQERGHELFIISSLSNNPECWAEKVEWLQIHFPFLNPKNFIASSRKGLMRVDVLVDDGLHNFVDFEGMAIIYDRPWNRDKKLINKYTNKCSQVVRAHAMRDVWEFFS